MRWVLRSKIHKATVTEANPEYVGSITVDGKLMEKAEFREGERVLVVSNTTGERLETYIVPGKRESGDILMNGGAALKIESGEEIIIMGFELTDKPLKPKIVLVDKNNRFVKFF